MPRTKIGSLDPLEERRGHVLVVVDDAALQGVALQQVPEGRFVITEVGVGLAEREMQLHLLLFGQRSDVAGERLQGLELRISGRELDAVREVQQHADGLRIGLQRFEIGRLRFVESAELLEQIPHIVVGLAQVRLERDRLLVARQRRLGLAELRQHLAHHVERLGVIGLEAEGTLARGPRLLHHVLVVIGAGKVGEGRVIARIHGNRLLQQRKSLVGSIEVQHRQGHVVEDRGIPRLQRHRLAVKLLGLLRLLLVPDRRAQVVVGVGIVRLQLDRAMVGRDGFGVFLLGAQGIP
jgi:hypothetical protein